VASFVSFERFFSFLLHVRLVALLTDIDGLRMFALRQKRPISDFCLIIRNDVRRYDMALAAIALPGAVIP